MIETLLSLGLLLLAVWLVWKLVAVSRTPAASVNLTPPPAPKTETKVFSAAELSQFGGQDGGPVYVGVKGLVFDVTKGRHMYGPGGPYAAFAGRDASRMLAKHMTSEAETGAGALSAGEEASLADWFHFFQTKYPQVGVLDSHSKTD